MPNSQRVAALLFGLGSITFIFTVPLYVVLFGAPEGTGPEGAVTVTDNGRHLLENRFLIRSIWIAESMAVCAHAIAAFVLFNRSGRERTVAPLGWVAFGVGSTIYLGIYPVMLGAYWPAAEIVGSAPSLLESFNALAVALFLIANIPINLGLALVFLAEARSNDPQIARWLAWLAALCGSLVATTTLYALASDGGMRVALTIAPIGGILFLISAYLGIKLALQQADTST